ncbi:MAG: hypothetical protein M3Z95_02035 [Actinomycetota bacterium]|nr:hypothetical protein [Actinomycetota bacterium]
MSAAALSVFPTAPVEELVIAGEGVCVAESVDEASGRVVAVGRWCRPSGRRIAWSDQRRRSWPDWRVRVIRWRDADGRAA